MVKYVMRPGDFLCKIDLKDAYQCVPTHQSCRKYLRFKWKGKVLKYRVLPFELASGPRLFTKITKPAIAILRRAGVRLVIYLDDMIILNQTIEGMETDRDSALHVLHNQSWVINWKKICFTPNPNDRISGMQTGLRKNDSVTATNKIREYTGEMSVSPERHSSDNSRIGKSRRHPPLNNGGSNPSSPVCQTITNAPNKISCKVSKLPINHSTDKSVQRRNILVDQSHNPVEWETNFNSEPKFNNRDRCISARVGVPLPCNRGKERGGCGMLR